ncbi:MAG: hypothetical protein CMO44_11945 [Verrucomicrobiales bacterium]|nr:hypothetical protein [Verrucomicrobiales bacterium]
MNTISGSRRVGTVDWRNQPACQVYRRRSGYTHVTFGGDYDPEKRRLYSQNHFSLPFRIKEKGKEKNKKVPITVEVPSEYVPFFREVDEKVLQIVQIKKLILFSEEFTNDQIKDNQRKICEKVSSNGRDYTTVKLKIDASDSHIVMPDLKITFSIHFNYIWVDPSSHAFSTEIRILQVKPYKQEDIRKYYGPTVINDNDFDQSIELAEANIIDRYRADRAVAAAVVELTKTFLADLHYEAVSQELLNKAEAGDDNAMYLLGVSFCRGVYFKKNMEKALEWFKRSADAGNIHGMAMYGDACYPQYKCALVHITQAATLGSDFGAITLAGIFLTHKDFVQARLWSEKVLNGTNDKVLEWQLQKIGLRRPDYKVQASKYIQDINRRQRELLRLQTEHRKLKEENERLRSAPPKRARVE